jgi:hypothetical protein
MRAGGARSFDGRVYRTALALCPAAFRREHGREMARDFDEACAEAAARGDGALWMLRLLMGIDLLRTFGVQWLRSGLPAIAFVSILVPLAIAEGLATLARRATIPLPADAVEADVVGILLLAVTSVVLIAMTIFLSLWVSRRSPRRRR